MRRLLYCCLLVCFSLMIGACGGSGGGGGNFQGIRDGNTRFLINNQMRADFASVAVSSNKTGAAVIYAGSFNCAASSSCGLAFQSDTPINDPFVFRFYDANSRLVAAYLRVLTPSGTTLITADDSAMGLYLYKEFDKANHIDLGSAQLGLETLFQNSEKAALTQNLTPDLFEYLSIYFDNTAVKMGQSEANFYTNLEADIGALKILPTSLLQSPSLYQKMALHKFEFKSVSILPSAYAADASTDKCSAGFNKFLKTFLVVGKLIDHPMIPKVFDVASNMMQGACANSPTDKLNQIDEKLNQILTKLDVLGEGLGDLKDTVMWDGIYESRSNFQETIRGISNIVDVYKNILQSKGSTTVDAVEYANLSEYFAATGGLGATSQFNAKQKAGFELLTSLPAQKLAFDKLDNQLLFQNFATKLNGVCLDEKTTTRDIIVSRNTCNSIVMQLVTQSYAAQASMAVVIADELKVINSTAAISFSNPYVTKTVSSTNENILTWLTVLPPGFDPLLNFPGNLKQSLISVKCTNLLGGVAVPSVVGWYSRPTATERGPYLITNCPTDSGLVKSKYYYAKNTGTTFSVINMMGVLVDSSFPQAATSGFGNTNKTRVASNGEYFSIPNSSKVNNTDSFSRSGCINSICIRVPDSGYVWLTNSGGYALVLYTGAVGKPYDTAYEKPSIAGYTTYFTRPENQYFYAVITVKSTAQQSDKSWYTYAVGYTTWINEHKESFSNFNCLTNDCFVDEVKSDVNFLNGPNVHWDYFRGPDDKALYNLEKYLKVSN